MPSRRERFQRISREAREQTNQDLASEISSLSLLTEDDVARLLPRKADKERFARLMAIVAAQADEATKVMAIRQNLDDLGEVLVRVLRMLL